MCMDDNADAKRILLASAPADWRRQLGRPRITWLSTIQQYLKHHHLTLPEAADLAQNRPLWRMMSTYGATQSWVACHKRRRENETGKSRGMSLKKLDLCDILTHCDNQKFINLNKISDEAVSTAIFTMRYSTVYAALWTEILNLFNSVSIRSIGGFKVTVSAWTVVFRLRHKSTIILAIRLLPVDDRLFDVRQDLHCFRCVTTVVMETTQLVLSRLKNLYCSQLRNA